MAGVDHDLMLKTLKVGSVIVVEGLSVSAKGMWAFSGILLFPLALWLVKNMLPVVTVTP